MDEIWERDGVKFKSITIPEAVEKLIVVSDIHSLIQPLDALDRQLEHVREDYQVVTAGDYFLNGTHPVETLAWVRENAGEYAVLGNHDHGTLHSEKGEFPSYTEAGAFNRLDEAALDYLASLPHILELDWRGKSIRVTHHLTPEGQVLDWRANVPEVLSMFTDPDVDLTVCAHTHYPFVKNLPGTVVANCGSASVLLLGHKRADGSISSKGEEEVFVPIPEIYSTYLTVTNNNGVLKPEIERFHYDIDAYLQELAELKHPNLDKHHTLFKTGVC